jgi:peptidylprolyl isomerase
MAVGETKTINIPSEEAYGARRDEMVATIPKAEFPDNIDPKEGMMLQMQTDRGPLPLKVVSVSEDDVTVDGNHPLAGQDLTFELTLVEVA